MFLGGPLFNDQTGPPLYAHYHQVNLAAGISGKSLNAWVVEQLQTAVARVRSIKAAKAPGKVKGKPKTVSKVVVKRKSKQAEQHA